MITTTPTGLTQETDDVKTYMAAFGADSLIVRHFQSDAFGVVGARNLVGLSATLKRDRRRAVRGVREMLKAFSLINLKEEILSISTGTNGSGDSAIVVVSMLRTEQKEVS